MHENWENHFFDLVTTRFKELQQQNAQFSLRQYAKVAKVSPSAMSQILKRNPGWKLTPGRSLEIVEKIFGPDHHYRHFAALLNQHVETKRQPLNPNHENLLADWTYLPILHSFDLQPHPGEDELAARMKISITKVKDVIHELESLGYLKRDPAGQLYRDETHFTTSDGPSNDLIKRHHKANLEVAKQALEMDVSQRDFTSMTFAGNAEQFETVRKEIRKVFERVLALSEGSPTNNEVYKLSVNFFPIQFK